MLKKKLGLYIRFSLSSFSTCDHRDSNRKGDADVVIFKGIVSRNDFLKVCNVRSEVSSCISAGSF
jgi:hypothetical protein